MKYDFQLIFAQSKVYGCDCAQVEYYQPWVWPTGGWFRKRLAFVRAQEAEESNVQA
jgi:hypothetical protein